MRSIPSWDEYFIAIAKVVAIRSRDPKTQVGCVIIDAQRRILSTGYNGFPPGFPETPELWEKPAKYQYVCHAEASAITYGGKDLRNSTLYVTLHPCNECAKLIAAAGIKRVVYQEDREEYTLSKQILSNCKIELTLISKK